LGQISKNYTTFYPKRCHKALKSMSLGSGIRNKSFPDPGVKKAPDPGSGSAKLESGIRSGSMWQGARLPCLWNPSELLCRLPSGDISRTVGADSGLKASRSCRAFSFSQSCHNNITVYVKVRYCTRCIRYGTVSIDLYGSGKTKIFKQTQVL
jgi:hypothetical protein